MNSTGEGVGVGEVTGDVVGGSSVVVGGMGVDGSTTVVVGGMGVDGSTTVVVGGMGIGLGAAVLEYKSA